MTVSWGEKGEVVRRVLHGAHSSWSSLGGCPDRTRVSKACEEEAAELDLCPQAGHTWPGKPCKKPEFSPERVERGKGFNQEDSMGR